MNKIRRKGIGYKRVSTLQQTDKFGFDVQEEMITDYARKHNIDIVVWLEESYTGDSDFRPEMNKVLAGDYDEYGVDCIIVAKSDRLARNIEYYYAFKLRLHSACGLELISASEDFGQAGIFAPAMEAMVAAYAEIERMYIVQRTSGGREAKRRTGGYCGGNAPYGYTIKNGSLEINAEQAKVVRAIFELKRQGLSLRKIAERLNQRGCRNASGGEFSFSTVAVILNNENTYRGLYRYGKDTDWVQGQHQPILKPAIRW